MRVGHGSAELPVPDGTPMGGYIDRPGPSTGLADPLSVSAVTWSDGGSRFALAIADVICVNEDLAGRARRAAGCELWLAASHTHAGPETGCVPGGGPTPEPWLDRITEAVHTAVRRAIEAERPCEGMAYRGELHEVGADRSRPGAPAVVPLDLIAVRDGGLAGLLVVLPVHPTVLPAANRLVSADLVGAVRASLRRRLGEDVWVAVATGAAGDISTRHTRRGQDTAELRRLGELVADRCAELLAGPGTPLWQAASTGIASAGPTGISGAATTGISWATRRLTLEPAATTADEAALLAGYERAAASGDPVATRLARSRLEGLRARTAPPVPTGVDVNVARLGGLALAGLPGEPFLAVAERVADRPGEPTVVLGYVNGYPGYLPTAAAYRRAEYEVLASQVAPGSAELIAETARTLLEEL
ncbi:hypothetical protein [Nonomuraea angiospora]|uniref:hypothetical protein n=1 Tax=Nonomuraea angiospora TaxID=46172 RepID=UPI0029A89CF3|nr:hypothetical protein [Nonomuraea angiospora]MDX3099629.1 hypothetical protein [Nonomuraea angiospora]